MAIVGSVDLSPGIQFVKVDHDPASTSTDAPKGSFIYSTSTSKLYTKNDDGATTNVSQHTRKNDYAGTHATPGSSDNFAAGWEMGSIIIDSSDDVHTCVGDGIWVQISPIV